MNNEKLNPSSVKAVNYAVARLSATQEWARLIQAYRAEMGGDANHEAFLAEVSSALLGKYVSQVAPLRVKSHEDPMA